MMKKLLALVLLVLLSATQVQAQIAQDTVYFWKADTLVLKQSIETTKLDSITFARPQRLRIAAVSTTIVTAINANTATSGGTITSSGNSPITAKGVVWSTAVSPTVALSTKTIDGVGRAPFTSAISGLADNTTYFVRAYATNNAGTGYGKEYSFKTLTAVNEVPNVTTATITSVTTTSAISGGQVVNRGPAVTARGVVWSTAPNPTIALPTKTVDGTGIGTFTSNITGLTANTTYYIRAYATNSVGTAYGAVLSFTTLPIPAVLATITTTPATAIATTTATTGGEVTADGGAPVTARGVVWSTAPNPTIALPTKTVDGTGIGVFTSSITGLVASTTYYYKAYATNSVGTVYGAEMSFTTTNPLGLCTAAIPAGTFIMGSSTTEVGRSSDETQHSVSLAAFSMSCTEITCAQYAAFANANNIENNGLWTTGPYPTEVLMLVNINDGLNYVGNSWVPVAGKANAPMVSVSWFGAASFAQYAGGRLPTEAEWEYAARATTTTAFNTGACLSNTQANYVWGGPQTGCSNSNTSNLWATQNVGTYAPNAWGLYDMHGNAWEWCSDWYGTYPTGAVSNPTGPATGSDRVLRGGSWATGAQRCRSARREWDYPTLFGGYGFRLVF